MPVFLLLQKFYNFSHSREIWKCLLINFLFRFFLFYLLRATAIGEDAHSKNIHGSEAGKDDAEADAKAAIGFNECRRTAEADRGRDYASKSNVESKFDHELDFSV